jgi:uncharacterized membrane protein YqhA
MMMMPIERFILFAFIIALVIAFAVYIIVPRFFRKVSKTLDELEEKEKKNKYY